MKLTVQVVIHGDDDEPDDVREVFTVQREALTGDTLGLQLAEAKDLLGAVQETVVDAQVNDALLVQAPCPHCQRPRRHKDTREIVVRSLFGTLRLPSPRWWHCPCRPQAAATFSPLAALVPERTTPELCYLQARFAGLAAYGPAAALLAEVLPLGRRLHATTVRRQTHAVAQRLEGELGDERGSFIDTCQRDREELPRPDLPITVSLDGGYVHSSQQRSRRDGWFEVIAGRSTPADGPAKCFGYVQTYDTKPKRRLLDLLVSQGMQANQAVTFLTDGGDDVRDLPRYLNPDSEHLLDWFHLTMRLTVMTNMAKSLRAAPPDEDKIDLSLPPDPATPQTLKPQLNTGSTRHQRRNFGLIQGYRRHAVKERDQLRRLNNPQGLRTTRGGSPGHPASRILRVVPSVWIPGRILSMAVNSSGQWLRPSCEGTKIIPMGQSCAKWTASCVAPLGIASHCSPSFLAASVTASCTESAAGT